MKCTHKMEECGIIKRKVIVHFGKCLKILFRISFGTFLNKTLSFIERFWLQFYSVVVGFCFCMLGT